MPADKKMINDIKWMTRQRLQFIEIMAYYTGVVTRSDVARSFGISDAAATKDLKFYNQIAPDNLLYKHNVFGFVPSEHFEELFADLSPGSVLPMFAADLAVAGNPAEQSGVYGINAESLPLPSRLPDKPVLAQIIRAIKNGKKTRIIYHSLSDRQNQAARIIEPHALVNTGLRWHIRAYSEENYDFRDFVLSRIVEATALDEDAESNAMYDDDWIESEQLVLSPHPGLNSRKRDSILFDYNAEGNEIRLQVRRALLAYVLQRLSVDTTVEHSMNPDAYQLVLVNREEIESFAGWAFL